MKKLTLTFLALLALTLTGCEDNRTQEQINADMAAHVSEFSYKGHQYILYRSDGVNSRIGGITHDPDCPCREKGVYNWELANPKIFDNPMQCQGYAWLVGL